MPSLFLASIARELVVLHAVSAVVLAGASTHHALISIGFLRGVYKIRLARIYAATVAVTWSITFALGLVAYPTFRYQVRVLYLDQNEPWATYLFDLKERFAALGIPLAICVLALSRTLEPREDRGLVRAYAAIVVFTAAIVWFVFISGLWVTLARGV
jgi:hypothetical protein